MGADFGPRVCIFTSLFAKLFLQRKSRHNCISGFFRTAQLSGRQSRIVSPPGNAPDNNGGLPRGGEVLFAVKIMFIPYKKDSDTYIYSMLLCYCAAKGVMWTFCMVILY